MRDSGIDVPGQVTACSKSIWKTIVGHITGLGNTAVEFGVAARTPSVIHCERVHHHTVIGCHGVHTKRFGRHADILRRVVDVELLQLSVLQLVDLKRRVAARLRKK